MGWTQEKLAALRARYADDVGDKFFDPHYQEIAAKIFGKGGYRPAPYAGMPTFLDAPMMLVEAPQFAIL